MSTEKLSTGCELSTASLKKREGEKRNPPCTPYREKGKGKEQDRVSCETSCSKPARVREAKSFVHVYIHRCSGGGPGREGGWREPKEVLPEG